MARRSISIAIVESLEPNQTVWDARVTGFCVRRQNGDARSYLVKAVINGRPKWMTIGRHGAPWTVDSARKEAQRLLGIIEEGGDPAGLREADTAKPTVAEAMPDYLASLAGKKREKTVIEYKHHVEKFVLTMWGKIRVDKISQGDAERLHRFAAIKRSRDGKPILDGEGKQIDTHRTANLVLAIAGSFCAWLEKHHYRTDNTNPCKRKHIERFEENQRTRHLSDDELARLSVALDEAEPHSLFLVALIRLLLATGARLDEIRCATWDRIDLERKTLTLPRSKTSKKTGMKTIHLSSGAVAILPSLPRIEGNPYVICGARPGACLVGVQKPWRRIRARAELDNVRIHDLRHSFASVLAANGVSLHTIGKSLGHTQASTTARYAHVANSTLSEAVNVAREHIDRAMNAGRAKLAPATSIDSAATLGATAQT